MAVGQTLPLFLVRVSIGDSILLEEKGAVPSRTFSADGVFPHDNAPKVVNIIR